MTTDFGTLIVGEEDKKTRRARLRREKQLARENRKRRAGEDKHRRDQEKQLWVGDYLHPEGLPGPEVGRSWRPGAVRPSRATMRPLRVLYPFLAESGLGARGMFIGQDAYNCGAFCFDPWDLYERRLITNPNISLAGIIGQGKSSLMKSLTIRGAAIGRKSYVPGDIKGEWSPVAEALGGAAIRLGGASPHRLNPLDAGVRPSRDVHGQAITDREWDVMVRSNRLGLLIALASVMLGRGLAPLEYTALTCALDEVAARHATPLITQVVEELLNPQETQLPTGVGSTVELAEMGREVGHVLLRLVQGDLRGTFDGPSTVKFDTSLPMVSVDLSAFGPGAPAIPLLMTCTAAWMEAALRDPDGGKRFIIYDEAHRLMGESSLLERMKDQWKLSRAWGISNVLVLHRFSDLEAVGPQGSKERALAEGLLADTSIRIVYKQAPDQLPATARILGLNNTATERIPELTPGQGLWIVGRRMFIVNHLRSRKEIELTNTDAAMIDHEE